MAWIELHQSMPEHKKTLRLADTLNIIEAQAVGHMAMFWLWALDNSPDGSLADVTPRMIARAAGWPGDPDAFCAALVHAGFLDQDEDGVLYIHDWDDYAGRLIEKREKNKQRMREARAANRAGNVQRTCDERATHVQRTNDARAGATIPYRTIPNHNVLDRSSNEIRVSTDDPPPKNPTWEPANESAETAAAVKELLKVWAKLDPVSSKAYIGVAKTRGDHIRAALSAGVPLDQLRCVIEEMAAAGAAPWEIRKEACRRAGVGQARASPSGVEWDPAEIARQLEREVNAG